MRSHTTARLRKLLLELPLDVRTQAYRAYARFRRDPSHSGLNFELVNQTVQMWSARINDKYRALGIREGADITWLLGGRARRISAHHPQGAEAVMGKRANSRTRITAEHVLRELGAGTTVDQLLEFLETRPHIIRGDILAALNYAAAR